MAQHSVILAGDPDGYHVFVAETSSGRTLIGISNSARIYLTTVGEERLLRFLTDRKEQAEKTNPRS